MSHQVLITQLHILQVHTLEKIRQSPTLLDLNSRTSRLASIHGSHSLYQTRKRKKKLSMKWVFSQDWRVIWRTKKLLEQERRENGSTKKIILKWKEVSNLDAEKGRLSWVGLEQIRYNQDKDQKAKMKHVHRWWDWYKRERKVAEKVGVFAAFVVFCFLYLPCGICIKWIVEARHTVNISWKRGRIPKSVKRVKLWVLRNFQSSCYKPHYKPELSLRKIGQLTMSHPRFIVNTFSPINFQKYTYSSFY